MTTAREIRDIRFVNRWGIVRTNRQQNVAEHSFFVALYVDQIADWIDYKGDRTALLRYALWHDMKEIITGDLPSPTNRWLGANGLDAWVNDQFHKSTGLVFNEADGVAREIIKVADTLDAVLFLEEEIQMGNTAVTEMAAHLRRVLEEQCEALQGGLRYKIFGMVHAAQRQSRITGDK